MAKSVDLAIEMGSFDTVIYLKNNGIVLREATLAAVRGGVIIAIGNEARKMIDKADASVEIVSPVLAGVIVEPKIAEACLKYFLQKIAKPRPGTNIRVLFCVSCGITPEELAAFERIAYKTGINEVSFVPGVVCAKLANGFSFVKGDAALICDIGASKTDIAIVNKLSIHSGITMAVGGYDMDAALCDFLAKNNMLAISETVAEKIKKEIGSLYQNDISNMEIAGIDLNTRLPKYEVVYSNDVLNAIEAYYAEIAKMISNVVANLPAGFAQNFNSNGVILCGGGASISGIEPYLKKKLDFKVRESGDNENIVIMGAGQLLADNELLAQVKI